MKKWVDREGDVLGIPKGGVLSAGEPEPDIKSPLDTGPDALVDVISGRVKPGEGSLEQQVAALAIYISQHTEPGHAAESEEVLAWADELRAAFIAERGEVPESERLKVLDFDFEAALAAERAKDEAAEVTPAHSRRFSWLPGFRK